MYYIFVTREGGVNKRIPTPFFDYRGVDFGLREVGADGRLKKPLL